MQETDLDLLVRAAKDAGDIALQYFRAAPKVWDKGGDAGPVTEADLAANAHLAHVLNDARPEYGWLSEENDDSTDRLDTDRQFVVDPIDGTRAFIEGSENWAQSLAVVENGVPQTAVVSLPTRGLVFTATKGGGAMLNGTAIAVTGKETCEGATVLANKRSFADAVWAAGTPPSGLSRDFRSSLAYRLCLVAQGRFDAMMTLRPTWEWDIAAGALIVTEAGGVVTDRNGAALTLNNRHPQVNGVLAGSPVISAIAAALVPDCA